MTYKIEKQENGNYTIRVWSKRDALGKRRSKQVRDIPEKKVKNTIIELSCEVENSFVDIKFLKLDDLYYEERKDKVSITTLTTSYVYDRKKARDFLGNIKARKINSAILQRFIDQEQKKGLKKKSVQNCVAYIMAVLNWGVNYDYLDYNHVKKLHYKEDEEEFEARTLDINELAEILCFMKENFYNLYIPTLISVLTSARRGEALGLTWDDIDFENKLIYFRNNLVSVEGKPVSKKALKTKQSKRVVAMADFLKEELLEHKEKFAIEDLENHVCSNVFIGMITPDYISHAFHDFVKTKYGIEMREHDLRHTFSQLIFDNELILLEKSRMMGHSSMAITQNVYTRHKVNDRMFTIVNTLGDELKKQMCAIKCAEIANFEEN